MTLLIIGLIAFLGIHLVPVMATTRVALVARWGEERYKKMFSMVSLAGLILIIMGYALAEPGRQLFAPSTAAIKIAPYAMVVVFILFAAANMRGHTRHSLKHPMVLAIILWSLVHLFANGDTRGTILFGGFLAYALIDLASVIRRRAVKVVVPSAKFDAIAIVAGTVVALVVMTFHRFLFGVKVVPFGL